MKQMSAIQRKLENIAMNVIDSGIRIQFAEDQNRAKEFTFIHEGAYFDFSKTHINNEIIEQYLNFAESVSFSEKRDDFFAGKEINNTERRAVLHPLLRSANSYPNENIDKRLIIEAQTAQQSFFKNCVQCCEHIDQTNPKIRDIIHIGIGGSSLGSQLIFEALATENKDINLHFLANVDGHQLQKILDRCDPCTTLIVAVSKSFKTQETLTNVSAIKKWFKQQGALDNFRSSLYAVTAKKKNAIKHGIPEQQIIKFPKWVGGRFSVWSSVSFSVALLLGVKKFEQFLDGASSMDHHFYQKDLAHNVCFIAAAMDHFYVNYCNSQSRAVFPYDFRLRSLVDYLQQLETESNGKERCSDGEICSQKTSPVVWGGIGTEVQHSVFQMLHQGTMLIPSEFLLVANAQHSHKKHHRTILANGLAQTAALLEGKSDRQLSKELDGKEISEATFKSKLFSGDRPSTTILLEELNSKTLGMLLAFYEHRTFAFGALCEINSFDQMGVELGKQLAKQLMPRLKNKNNNQQCQFDPSTEELLEKIIRLQRD